ncbi:MAG: hypothetical protein MUF64_00910 [Polyangiaceae bacterium]|nr:hypothetical protein [Polyangiaceae bacterium]
MGKGKVQRRAIAELLGRLRQEPLADATVLLESRGLRVTKAQAAQVRGCSDEKKLDRWLVRAMTAESTSALLEARAKTQGARRRGTKA